MYNIIKGKASACLTPLRNVIGSDSDDEHGSTSGPGSGSGSGSGHVGSLIWSRDLGKHYMGEYSYAVIQGNNVVEDNSQVESGSNGIFVGVYDGHGGDEASRFVNNNLFSHLIGHARDNNNGVVSEDVIRSAFAATEAGFLNNVASTFPTTPLVAAVGSCCLVGFISQGTLLVANLGDSRAVMGSRHPSNNNNVVAQQLTQEHNVSDEQVRQELIAAHPDDPNIVFQKNGAWRVKGIIQVSRAIGDAYLKSPDFALGPSYPRFHMSEPLVRAALSAEPSIHTRDLQPNDLFLIFASDGLWEHLTNQEAVDLVHKRSRRGIAKRLVKKALKKVAKRHNMRYKDVKKVDRERRRQYHDDITVVVVYLDHRLLAAPDRPPVPERSIKAFADSDGISDFRILREIQH